MFFNFLWMFWAFFACTGEPIPECPDVALEEATDVEQEKTESVQTPKKSVLLLEPT